MPDPTANLWFFLIAAAVFGAGTAYELKSGKTFKFSKGPKKGGSWHYRQNNPVDFWFSGGLTGVACIICLYFAAYFYFNF